MTTTLSGRTKGAIVGIGLFAGVVSGGLWTSEPASAQPQADGCTVMAGRAGALPCTNPYANTPDSREVRKVVGQTFTGGVLGLLSGGPGGALYGAIGGAAAAIPW